MGKNILTSLIIYLIILSALTGQNSKDNIGMFESWADIGKVGIQGSSVYTTHDETYVLNGAGENMWFEKDAFYYVWKKVSGDFSLAASIEWIGEDGNPHRKAGIIIRQNLNPGSAYVDAVIHGDGLTSLQFRELENSITHEIQSNITSPEKIMISKEGNYFHMSAALKGEEFKAAGGSIRLNFNYPFYVGLGVCSHDSTKIETAIFKNVIINKVESGDGEKIMIESTIETININSKNRKVIYTANEHLEAPNWSKDGTYLVFNSNGLIYKLNIMKGIPEKINTDFAINCNNDHGLSPDNSEIVISDQTMSDKKSRIYILPIDGGDPKLITDKAPSYWHGWSPNGKMLAYCAERDGQYDVYTIPVEGGEEIQLTDTEGLDDGPEYSPDGRYIYFNSVRSGKMQIWRMNNDGTDQIQITKDEYNNWFPHPSPDGKWIVFLTYEKDIVGHPANKDVMLRMMAADGGEIQILTKLFGGQGTINVPSWSPDSQNIAFVSYRLVNKIN